MRIQSGWFRIDLEYYMDSTGRRAAGSGDWNICERIHFGNMYPEKTEYCIYHWILTIWYFLVTFFHVTAMFYWKPKWSVWSIWTYSTGWILNFVIQKVNFGRKLKMVRVPVFLSSKLSQNGSCSSISQFKTDETGSFSNIFLIPINSDGISK